MTPYSAYPAPLLAAIHGWSPDPTTNPLPPLSPRTRDSKTSPVLPLTDRLIEVVTTMAARRAISTVLRAADIQVCKLITALQKSDWHKAMAVDTKLTELLTALHRDNAAQGGSVTGLVCVRLVKGLSTLDVDLCKLRSKIERLEEAHDIQGNGVLQHLTFLIKVIILKRDVVMLKKLGVLVRTHRVNPAKDLLPTHLTQLAELKRCAQRLLSQAHQYTENGVIVGTQVKLRYVRRAAMLDLTHLRREVVHALAELATSASAGSESNSHDDEKLHALSEDGEGSHVGDQRAHTLLTDSF